MFRFVFLLVLPFVLSPATAVSQRNATPVTITKTHYFDLSYSINNDTIYFPGQKVEFSLNKDIRGYTSGGYWYASYSFCMGEHGGTHLDSPVHFNKDGWTLDEIPANHLIDVPATIINVEQAVFGSAESPDKFLLEVHHLIEHESVHGEIPFRGVVLVHTGWAKYWPNKVKYLGWDNSTSGNGSQVLNFPGVSEEAAKWLANERGIVGLGIDTPSVDVGNNNGNYPVHVLFGERQIYNLENVANMHLVIQTMKHETCNLRLFVLPLKITGGTGGPTRILAYCKF